MSGLRIPNIPDEKLAGDITDKTLYYEDVDNLANGTSSKIKLSEKTILMQQRKTEGYSSRFGEAIDVDTIGAALDFILDFQQLAPNIIIAANPAFGLREFGDDVVNPEITGTAQLGQNPPLPPEILTLMEFFRGGTGDFLFASEATPTPGVGYPKTDTHTVDANQTYTVKITNNQVSLNTDTAAGTYSFVYPFYYGWVDEPGNIFDGITRAQILALPMTFNVKVKSNTAWSASPSNGRFCIMYPDSYGNLTSILDKNQFETITNYDVFQHNVVGLDGSSQLYKVYILKTDTNQTAFINTAKF